MVKVRIQLAGEGGSAAVRSPLAVAGGIIRNEGFFSLYKGYIGPFLSISYIYSTVYCSPENGWPCREYRNFSFCLLG